MSDTLERSQALRTAGNDAFRAKRFPEALEKYQAALGLLGDDATAATKEQRMRISSNLVLVLLKMERFAEAQSQAEAALMEDPDHTKLRCNHIRAMLSQPSQFPLPVAQRLDDFRMTDGVQPRFAGQLLAEFRRTMASTLPALSAEGALFPLVPPAEGGADANASPVSAADAADAAAAGGGKGRDAASVEQLAPTWELKEVVQAAIGRRDWPWAAVVAEAALRFVGERGDEASRAVRVALLGDLATAQLKARKYRLAAEASRRLVKLDRGNRTGATCWVKALLGMPGRGKDAQAMLHELWPEDQRDAAFRALKAVVDAAVSDESASGGIQVRMMSADQFNPFAAFTGPTGWWGPGSAVPADRREEWLVDAWQLRVDDMYVWKSTLISIYDQSKTYNSVKTWLVLMSKMLVARGMVPTDHWSWPRFVERLCTFAGYATEKSDIQAKWTQTTPMAMRATMEALFGSGPRDWHRRDEMFERMQRECASGVRSTDSATQAALFSDIGGVALWSHLHRAMRGWGAMRDVDEADL